MTDDELDPQIEDAYRRLGTALAPPPDVAVRVTRLVATRRRRRRVAAAGVAGVVAAGVVGGALVFGGADPENSDSVAVDTGGPTGSFVLTRPDGSTYELSDLTLTCKPPFGSGDDPDAPGPQRIWLVSPVPTSSDGKLPDNPVVEVTGIVDQIDGQTFQLPLDSTDSDHAPLILFAFDTDSVATAGVANEVSSQEEEAAGTVVVARASCEPTPVLELTVDVTLGSEIGLNTLALAGSFG